MSGAVRLDTLAKTIRSKNTITRSKVCLPSLFHKEMPNGEEDYEKFVSGSCY